MLGHLWIIGVMLVINSVEDTQGCSCLPSHPQRQFCSSSFVIRARAISKEIVPVYEDNFGTEMAKYTVKVLEAFKFDGTCEDFPAVHIWTSKSSASCGVFMEIGSEYLLSGYAENGLRKVNSCFGLNSAWQYVQPCTKHYLFNDIYKKNCDECKINNCFGKNCILQPKGCKYDQKHWNSICELKKGYYGSQCSWTSCEYEKKIEPISTRVPPKKILPTKVPLLTTTGVPPPKKVVPLLL